MPSENETTVGLTKASHEILKTLKDEGYFEEMRDGYRLGISIAIAMGRIASEEIKTSTIFNVGSLDPNDLIKTLILNLYPEAADQPYRYAERLAEWGVSEMARLYENQNLKFSILFEQVYANLGT